MDQAPEVTVRRAGAVDIATIVEIHVAAFPGFFLTGMGAPFLRSYYHLVADYECGSLLLAETEGRAVGFVVMFRDPAGFYRHLRRNRVRLWWPATQALLRRPRLLRRLLSNRRRVGGYAGGGAYGGKDACELSSIGVDPAASGRGIGRLLLAEAQTVAADECAAAIVLTTDADGNDGVNSFYRNAGYELVETFDSGQGRWMNRYILRLEDDRRL